MNLTTIHMLTLGFLIVANSANTYSFWNIRKMTQVRGGKTLPATIATVVCALITVAMIVGLVVMGVSR
jgi:hypothetical protein